MRYRRLGRTGLEVSVLSLGTGGPNRLGQARFRTLSQVTRLVRQALDSGINLFDTSAAYEDSESRLGRALHGVPRGEFLLAGKVWPWSRSRSGDRLLGPEAIRAIVERSLRRLGVDELDLLQIHRVTPKTYEVTRDRVLPVFRELREAGLCRWIGVTESSRLDLAHRMLTRAIEDDAFDTVMLSYGPSNPSAETGVLAAAAARDVGVLSMHAARHCVPRSPVARVRIVGDTLAGMLLSPPSNLGHLRLRLTAAARDLSRPSPRKSDESAAHSDPLPEAAYRFVLSRPEVHTVLTGTINPDHLERNLAAALGPALSDARRAELVDRVSGSTGVGR